MKEAKFSQAEFQSLMEDNARLYTRVALVVPETLEKQQMLVKLTETGMWLRMCYEMEQSAKFEPQASLKTVTQ